MSKSIAVFGAGPGLGQAVARRYAREGYAVTLVGRRPEPLNCLAKDLTSAGATAHVITADLSDTGATPRLAEQIRAGPCTARRDNGKPSIRSIWWRGVSAPASHQTFARSWLRISGSK